MTEPLQVIEIFATKVWIEDDFLGDKHVMVQHQDGHSKPFTYCTFFYDYAYTDNATISKTAERMALALGATEPVERRFRTPELGGRHD